MTELKERNAGLTKELKEAQNQRKLAMAEFSEINDKLAELRSQKTKLSRSQREKEEELGKCTSKIFFLNQCLVLISCNCVPFRGCFTET